VKLLRVLQDFEFEQVGGGKTFHTDSRVILATNEDLELAVAQSRFRQDLYYRINVINLRLPSLRERITDIPLLARHFLQRVCSETGKKVEGFTDEAVAALQRYAWPGNVRELQNVVERAVLLGKDRHVTLSDLPADLTSGQPIVATPTSGCTLKEALEGPERQIILDVLRSNNWNRNATADQLGINRTTLYKKMKRLGLETPTSRRPIDPALRVRGGEGASDYLCHSSWCFHCSHRRSVGLTMGLARLYNPQLIASYGREWNEVPISKPAPYDGPPRPSPVLR
jgi:DNA-binding NtrC family response regulator